MLLHMDLRGALERALSAYLAEAVTHVSSRRKSAAKSKVRRLRPAGTVVDEMVRGWFAECEVLESWRALLSVWEQLLDSSVWVFDSRRHSLAPSGLLSTWLKRSGAYAEIAAGRLPAASGLATRLVDDANKASVQRRMACLVSVSPKYPFEEGSRWPEDWGFPVALSLPKCRLDLGGFEVWAQADASKLEEFFQCGCNALFFSDSVTSVEGIIGAPLWLKTESRAVHGMPFSSWRKQRSAGWPGVIRNMRGQPVGVPFDITFAEFEHRKPFSYLRETGWLPFEPWAEDLLGAVLLWGWTVDILDNARDHLALMYEVPLALDFALEWPLDLFEPPPTVHLESGAAQHLSFCDNASQSDKHDCNLSVWLNDGQLSEFESFVKDLSNRVGRIGRIEKWWSRIETGRRFLIKSWAVQHDVEKFLWSVVALEALLSREEDKTAGIKKGISSRLTTLCGKMIRLSMPNDVMYEAQDIVTLFSRVYNLRSNIVHGSEFDNSEFEKVRFLVFALARSALTRLIYVLGNLAPEFADKADDKIPSYESILKAIDQRDVEPSTLARRIRKMLEDEPFHWPCEHAR